MISVVLEELSANKSLELRISLDISLLWFMGYVTTESGAFWVKAHIFSFRKTEQDRSVNFWKESYKVVFWVNRNTLEITDLTTTQICRTDYKLTQTAAVLPVSNFPWCLAFPVYLRNVATWWKRDISRDFKITSTLWSMAPQFWFPFLF